MTTPTVEYFTYYGRTYKFETAPDGRKTGYLLNWNTGEFEVDNSPMTEIAGASSTTDITGLDEETFIRKTEQIRSHFLRGDGPIFALYDTIDAIFAQAEAENRKITDEELALINSIRRRTFAMWEAETARRAAGEPPTFSVTYR